MVFIYLLWMASVRTGTRLEGAIAPPSLQDSSHPIFHYGIGIDLSSIFAEEIILLGTVGETSLLASI